MNRQRIFWTCVLPENIIGRYGLSFAACNFSFNLISGGGFDKVYSSMPLFVGGEMSEEAFSDERFELIYDKFRYKKGIFQKIATLKEQWTIFKKIPQRSSVWFYNLNILNAWLYLLLKVFKPTVSLNIIVLDFTPKKKGFGLNGFYLKLINSAHGRICLTNSDLFNKKNSAVLPGVAPKNITAPEITTPNKVFLLSGVLSEQIAMLDDVLKTFSGLPQCTLHITGNQGNESLLKKYSEENENIHWHGQVTKSEYLSLLYEATYLLSTRDPSYPENECNFPSKIIEGLLHNRIIVSTIHYPQIEGIMYFKVNDLKSDISAIVSRPAEETLSYANQSEDVKIKFSPEIWNQTMAEIEKSR